MPRLVVLALAVLAATPGVARAGLEDEPAWPRRSTAVAIGGNTGRLHNESIGGPALVVEHALGHRRWQLVAEGIATWYVGDSEGRGAGAGAHVALGGRWLARSFQPDTSAAIEMTMAILPGVEHLELVDGRVTRPDLTIGWGWQVRAMRDRRWTIRFDIRFAVAPSLPARDVARLVCRGQCTSAPPSLPFDEALRAQVGFAW